MRVIAFGIGTSAKVYLKNYKDEFDIIGLSDWDKDTHGTERYGFKIIDPYSFNKYRYDKILILSYYTKEIIQQLEERVGIKPDRIIVPLKYKIKGEEFLPFKNKKTLKMAEDLIIYFSKLMRDNKVDLFLEFGTLLGIVRGNKIIEWDDDIDFSVNSNQSSKAAKLLLDNRFKFPYSDLVNYSAVKRVDKNNNIWYISLAFRNKEIDNFTPFEIAFGVRKEFGDKSVCMRGRYISCNSEHFSKYEMIDFNSEKLLIPYKAEKYLDFVYGDWKTPKMFSFGENYGSLDNDFSSEYKVETKNEILFN